MVSLSDGAPLTLVSDPKSYPKTATEAIECIAAAHTRAAKKLLGVKKVAIADEEIVTLLNKVINLSIFTSLAMIIILFINLVVCYNICIA